MTFWYLILGAILALAAVAWMRLERSKQDEALESKVEPDLNDLFETASPQGVESRVEFSEEGVTPQKEAEYFEPIESEQSYSVELETRQEEVIFDLESNIHDLAEEAARLEAEESRAEQRVENSSVHYMEEASFGSTYPEAKEEAPALVRQPIDESASKSVSESVSDENPLEQERQSRFDQKSSGLFGGLKKLFGKEEEKVDFSHDKTFLRPATIESYGFILKAPEEQPYTFREIFEVAAEIGLSARNNDFLEYVTTTHWGDEEMYQVAHLLGDGRFTQDIIEYHLDETVPGLFFFSKIPGADPDIAAIEYLMAGIEVFINSLGGEILSSDKERLSKEQLAEIYIDIAKREKEAWDHAFDSQYNH